MEIRHFKLVKAVAEEGNLTRAAQKLFLTQSALSHQLKEIEDDFGASLFQRVNKKMVLTPVGDRILKSAEAILGELVKVENDVRKVVSGEAGIIRISTECYTCYHWLPQLLKSFNRKFPHVEVQIVAECTRQPQKFLLEGKLDLAIVSCLTKAGEDGHLRCTKLFVDELVVVVNVKHRFAAQQSVRAEDFAREHLICYIAPIEVLDIYQRVLLPAGVKPKKVTQIQITEAIIEMVKANLGITVMARWAVKPYLKSKELVTIPVADHALERTWYAVTINQKNEPCYIKWFVNHLLTHPLTER
jgi:LysR family transcriptional regulator for metE and metH